MKFFAVLIVASLAVAAYGLSEEEKTKLKGFSQECKTQTGVNVEHVEKMKQKVFVQGDDKFYDYCMCMMKKIKFITEDGSVDVDHIKTKIPAGDDKAKAETVINDCSKVGEGKNKAWSLAKCLAESKYKITIESL
ncbi:PREDICTED: uncharacterized protein LOC108567224 [Nicrophorus vespilloides]|uniref:Uncharacterized protein LOC108567224 n=1 Tax=Nicrophorus vespilloides TaxID=110193 RepID=A0ABM1N899_NICVS|nr:PREDICTED: uncharacterized protein LOC108567224 [Nicrophorus vespilloides]